MKPVSAPPVSKVFNPLCTFHGGMVYDARVPAPIIPNVLIGLNRNPLTPTCLVLETRHYHGMTALQRSEAHYILRTGLLDPSYSLAEFVDIGKIPYVAPIRKRHRIAVMEEFTPLPGAAIIGGCIHCHQHGIYVVGLDRFCSRHRHLAFGSTFDMALLTAATHLADVHLA